MLNGKMGHENTCVLLNMLNKMNAVKWCFWRVLSSAVAVLDRAMAKTSGGSTRRSLPIALLRTREAVMQQFRPHLANLGLTEQQWRVLRVLGEDGPSEAGQVAQRTCILPPSLSRILRTLETMKLLATESHKDDGRRTVVRLAPGGEKLLLQALPQTADIYARLEKRVGKHKLQQLLDLLDEVQDQLDAAD
jgi:homoprotocatechuate degradation regulator HpaR